MGLQVVDLVLEAITPDLEGDALVFGEVEPVPVDVFDLADPAGDDRRQGELLSGRRPVIGQVIDFAHDRSINHENEPDARGSLGSGDADLTRAERRPGVDFEPGSNLTRSSPPSAARPGFRLGGLDLDHLAAQAGLLAEQGPGSAKVLTPRNRDLDRAAPRDCDRIDQQCHGIRGLRPCRTHQDACRRHDCQASGVNRKTKGTRRPCDWQCGDHPA